MATHEFRSWDGILGRDPGTATLREAYHTCQEAGALPASQKVVQHRWAEVTLFQPLAGETENGGGEPCLVALWTVY